MANKKNKIILLLVLITILLSFSILFLSNTKNKCDGVAWYSFQRNGDTIYKDCNTSLMWTNSSALKYQWASWANKGINEPTDSCINIPNRQACNYCENLSYGGYDDWFLPNMIALKSFCFLNIIQDGEYRWSSDEHRVSGAEFIWFNEACNKGQGGKSAKYKLVCVRGLN